MAEINPLVVEIEKAARSSKLIEFYKLIQSVRDLLKNSDDEVYQHPSLLRDRDLMQCQRYIRRCENRFLRGCIPKLNRLIGLIRVEVEEEDLGEVTGLDMEMLHEINEFQSDLFDRGEQLVNQINADPTPEQLAQIRIEINQIKVQGKLGMKNIKKFMKKTVRFLETIEEEDIGDEEIENFLARMIRDLGN